MRSNALENWVITEMRNPYLVKVELTSAANISPSAQVTRNPPLAVTSADPTTATTRYIASDHHHSSRRAIA